MFPRDPAAKPGERGHWAFVPRPQRRGRWDNADHYDSWYVAGSPTGAIAEVFWSFAEWTPSMLLTPAGARWSLATLELPDDVAVFVDLDDAGSLQRFGLRPSQVVRRTPEMTQAAAARIFEVTRGDDPVPIGLSWWSAALPEEDVFVAWTPPGSPPPFTEVDVEELTIESSHVVEASELLPRTIRAS